MTCKNCGAQLAPEEKFCGECGAPVIQQVVEEPVVQEQLESFKTNTDSITKTENINNHKINNSKEYAVLIFVFSLVFSVIITIICNLLDLYFLSRIIDTTIKLNIMILLSINIYINLYRNKKQ